MSTSSLEAKANALEREIMTIRLRIDQDPLTLISKEQELDRILDQITEASANDPDDE